MSVLALTAVHARYSILETLRTPIAVIGTLAFPALALLFFVVPQEVMAGNPIAATQAVISLCVFSVMVGSLFSFGIGIAENREKAWEPYLRTLPASGIVRVLAHILSTGAIALVALVPLLVIGALLTSATAEPLPFLLGIVTIVLSSLPFMLLGMAIGYSLSVKAAIAVVQVVFFALAFGGGLFLPPMLFPAWLDMLSRFLPSRQARDLVIWAVQSGELQPLTLIGLVAWIGILLLVVLALARRDEGRRFR